jgi:DHA1 family multidrug resistance protein-like MFS transporter
MRGRTPPITPQVTIPKRIPTTLAFLSVCIALLMTGFGIIVPVFPQRLEALGLGAETLALMEGAFGLGMFLCSTPIGTLADHIGRKPIVLISLSGFIVTNLVLAVVNIPLVFILIRFVEGMSISGLMPASMAMVGDTIPGEKQGRWIGFITAAQAAGFALGPGVGGFLYQAWGFSSTFLISAAIALIACILALVVLPETLSHHVREQTRLRRVKKLQVEKGSNVVSPSPVPVLLRTFFPLLIVDVGITFIYPFVLPQIPFYFTRVLGYSVARFGVIVSVYGLALAAFPILMGRLSDVFPKKLLIISGSLLYSALNVGMLILHQYGLLIGAATVTGIGNALLIPALSTIYLGATTEQNRSQVMGIRGTAISLGTLLGPLAQALASPWITPEITFAIGIALSFVIAFVVLVELKR